MWHSRMGVNRAVLFVGFHVGKLPPRVAIVARQSFE
jgi:hypothetical protein